MLNKFVFLLVKIIDMPNKYSFSILLFLFLFNSCSKDDPVIINYKLTTSVTPVDGGLVSPSEEIYTNGTEVSLEATPTPDYEFVEWKGGLTGNSNPTTLIMDSDINVIAVFQKKFTLIPNANFEQVLIDLNIDSDGILNGRVLTSDISGVIYLPLFDSNISDLAGIENFTSLRKLDCNNNQLTSLDLSKNTMLKELDCHSNQLISLDVSQNTALTSLICFDNQLTNLDISQNTLLATLGCSNNQLTSLDVSQNSALLQLYCNENALTSINVSNNPDLMELYFSDNQLTSIDISQNLALTELYAPFNQLATLDISQNTALTKLDCFNNQLISLDVSQNIALIFLVCYENQISSLDLSQNIALTTFNGIDNQLLTLDIKNGNNSIITEFNVTGNNNLQCIQIDNETNANAGQAPYDIWVKDVTALYSENCDSP